MNRYDADLFAVRDEARVGKGDGAVSFAAHKLLQAVIIEMVGGRNAHHGAMTALDLFNAYQNVGVGLPPGVREGEDVFENFALLFRRPLGKRITAGP